MMVELMCTPPRSELGTRTIVSPSREPKFREVELDGGRGDVRQRLVQSYGRSLVAGSAPAASRSSATASPGDRLGVTSTSMSSCSVPKTESGPDPTA